MRLMVISDIHGSTKCLIKALETFRKENANQLIILGDFLSDWPLANNSNADSVPNLLNRIKDKIIAIRGNCDRIRNDELFQFPLLSELIMTNGNRKFFFTHGDIYNEINLPPLQNGDCLIHGHFHIPWIFEKYGIIIASPGSISMPRANSNNSYIIIENGIIDIKDLSTNESITSKVKRGAKND